MLMNGHSNSDRPHRHENDDYDEEAYDDDDAYAREDGHGNDYNHDCECAHVVADNSDLHAVLHGVWLASS